MSNEETYRRCQQLRDDLEAELAAISTTRRQASDLLAEATKISNSAARILAEWDQVLGAFVEARREHEPDDDWWERGRRDPC